MPPFPKPKFTYNYRVASQIDALQEYKQARPGRDIPDKASGRLLLATWNIANLGLQDRRVKDYQIIAELVSWFDLVAIQEVNDNLDGLRDLRQQLPTSYRVLFSDKAGNNERLAFIYDGSRVTLLDKVGEIAIPPKDKTYIKLPGISQKFRGFDRNPYLAAFRAEGFTFVLVNVHLYFGSAKGTASKRAMNRRSLETFAVGRWADLRRRSDNAFSRNIIPLGDFNLPKVEPGDPIFKALTKRGLHLPQHSTETGSNLKGDQHYDQIAFFPGPTQRAFVQSGVFDFDGAIFSTLWKNQGKRAFSQYVRYYISDHRPLWAEFRV